MSIQELLKVLKFNPETMSISEKFSAGLLVMLLSMWIVFIVLVIISTLIKAMSNLFKKNKEEIIEKIEEKEDLINDTQLVAVITAAIMSSTSRNIVVKKIVRSNNTQSNWERVQ